jgi:hypothetical protein
MISMARVTITFFTRDVTYSIEHSDGQGCLCDDCWLEYLEWCERQMGQQAA